MYAWRIVRAQACNVRTCNGIWQLSHLVVVSDSELFLSTHSYGQATGLHNDVREFRRHNVRLSESIQLILTSVKIHVDGKITTGIEGIRKIGDIKANQQRPPRRVDETANMFMGAMKVLESVTSPTKKLLEASQATHPNLSRAS